MPTFRRTMLILVGAAICGAVSAKVASFTLGELAHQSKTIFVGRVERVAYPKWHDENNNQIVLAELAVLRPLKGRLEKHVMVAFKARVSDEPQLSQGREYVVFGFGPESPLLLAHQLLALPVEQDQIITEDLHGEPKAQPLEAFLERITKE